MMIDGQIQIDGLFDYWLTESLCLLGVKRSQHSSYYCRAFKCCDFAAQGPTWDQGYNLMTYGFALAAPCLGGLGNEASKLDEAASSSKCVRCRFAWVVNSSLVSLHQADARLQKQRQQGEKLLSFETCLVAVWFVPLFSETCGDLGPKSKAVTPLHITHHVDFVAVVDRFFCQPSARMYNRFS
jgi:hypothetical protein